MHGYDVYGGCFRYGWIGGCGGRWGYRKWVDMVVGKIRVD